MKKLGGFHTKEHNNKISLSLVGNRRNSGKKASDEKKWGMSQLQRGKGNPMFDHSTYTFFHELTYEQFTGTRYEFIHKFNLRNGDVCQVIHKNRRRVKNWCLVT